MALKRKITKEKFEKLPEELQSEYSEKDGAYYLNVEGFDDPVELKRGKDREVEKRKAAEKKARDLESKLDEIEGDNARNKGDIDTLEKSWKSKFEKMENDFAAKLERKDGFIRDTLVDNVAKDIASNFKNPKLMLPHIKARLSADIDGDEPKTIVLDENGKQSALSTKELSAEFIDNPDFSDMIIASRATGSGASGKNNSSGGGAPKKDVDWSNASGKEFAEYLKAKEEQQG